MCCGGSVCEPEAGVNCARQHAARVLENPEAGPKRIYFSSTDLSVSESLYQLHDQFPRKKQGVIYLYQLSIVGDENALASLARAAFRKAQATNTWNIMSDNKGHMDSSSLYVGTSESMPTDLGPILAKEMAKQRGLSTYLRRGHKWIGRARA